LPPCPGLIHAGCQNVGLEGDITDAVGYLINAVRDFSRIVQSVIEPVLRLLALAGNIADGTNTVSAMLRASP